jgi:hypothetical protein
MKTYERTFPATQERDCWVAEQRQDGGLLAGSRAMEAPGCCRLRGRRQAGICLDTVTLFLANADPVPAGFREVGQ